MGTPIGNLGDLTLRAVEVLGQVAYLAAEDTRRARALLSHLHVTGTRLIRLDAHAPRKNIEEVTERLAAGRSVALISDAGMPSISDPGVLLVREVRRRGLPVTVVPGPSALTAAVAVSGLVQGPFWFLGFLPRRGPRRRKLLHRIGATAEPVVLFEAPSRMSTTLSELLAVGGERTVCICRELTKLHEEILVGSLSEFAERTVWRGEVTLVLGPVSMQTANHLSEGEILEFVARRLADGHGVKDVIRELAGRTGLTRRELYALANKLRDSERS